MAQCTFSWHSCKLCLSYSSHFHFVLFQHRAFFPFAAEHNLYVTLDMMESRRVDSSHVVHKQLCNLSNFLFFFLFSFVNAFFWRMCDWKESGKIEDVSKCTRMFVYGRQDGYPSSHPISSKWERSVYVYLIVCRYSNILFKVVSLSLSLSLSCSSFDYKLSWCCCLQLYSECIPKEEKIKISFWMQLLFPCFSYFVFLLLLLLMRLMILLFADDANGMKHRREWKIKKGKLKIVHSTF